MSSKIIIQIPPFHPFEIKSLDPELDKAFVHLYTSFFKGSGQSKGNFQEAALAYFDKTDGHMTAADEYFFNFTPLWLFQHNSGPLYRSLEVWQISLAPALEWERRSGRRLHKGAPYYFSAASAIVNGDLDVGYLYAHKALAEDALTHHNPTPPTPSYALVVMNADETQQMFRDWVQRKADYVTGHLEIYRQEHARTLTWATLRTKFLMNQRFKDEAFLFSYSIARLWRLRAMGSPSDYGTFGSQHGSNVLFDLTTVVESVLRVLVKPVGRSQFKDLAARFSSSKGLQLSDDRLGALNKMFETDFDKSVESLLDGQCSLNDGFTITKKAMPLAITYGCRNRGAHHVEAKSVFGNRFDAILEAVLATLFLAIESLP